MRMFRPLRTKQTPRNAEYYHKNINKSKYLCSVLNNIIGTCLNNCCVKSEDIESRNEITINH